MGRKTRIDFKGGLVVAGVGNGRDQEYRERRRKY